VGILTGNSSRQPVSKKRKKEKTITTKKDFIFSTPFIKY